MAELLPIKPGRAIPRRDIPHLEFAVFRRELLAFAQKGHIVQLFAYREAGGVKLLAVLRNETLFVVGCDAPDAFPALTGDNEKFHLFEREMAEQYGLCPLDHPWLKPVRYHANYEGRPDVFGNDYSADIPGAYEYFRVEGDEIHEVAVGPVHAGIIEPGHFRFQCIGERVLHLEIQLGYQHRGVERLLSSVTAGRRPIIVESIAGDTAIGHSLCFAQAIEALGGLTVGRAAKTVRTITLELERIANHVGDLGALSGDVAFNPPAAWFGRLRGEFLNLLLMLSGNRFGKSLIRPGGTTAELTEAGCALLTDTLLKLRPQIEAVGDLLFTAHTVLGRFESCGTVSREQAARIGLVGVAGRASGLTYDARDLFPTEAYGGMQPCQHKRTRGDVMSRALVRFEEILHAMDLIAALAPQAVGTAALPEEEYRLAPASFVVTVNEGWRGELSHCLLTDEHGNIMRYKVKDPSFHNWTGLALALRDEEISDFPLNNKSFNLSYCGFDL